MPDPISIGYSPDRISLAGEAPDHTLPPGIGTLFGLMSIDGAVDSVISSALGPDPTAVRQAQPQTDGQENLKLSVLPRLDGAREG